LATRKTHSYHAELVRFGKELGKHNGCGRHVESIAQKPAQVYSEEMGERFSERAIIMHRGDGGAAQTSRQDDKKYPVQGKKCRTGKGRKAGTFASYLCFMHDS
jgi:hypothetical protein